MSKAAVSKWLAELELLGRALTTSRVHGPPPFGVELVRSEGCRRPGLSGFGWDPTELDLELEADRRARGLWTPPPVDPVRRARFSPAELEVVELVDVPLPGLEAAGR